MKIWIGNNITDNYAWEFSALHRLRETKDGISFFEFTVNWDRFIGDHSPKFDFMLVILNYTIFEFNIYYRWHRDN